MRPELRASGVEADVSLSCRTFRGPAAVTCVFRVAVVLCVAAAAFSAQPAGAWALSGYAGDQPPVNVQYPDAGYGAGGVGGGGTSLGGLMTIQAKADPDAGGRHHRTHGLRKIQSEVARREAAALASAPGLGVGGTGAIAVLLGAAGVFAAAGLLRSQRGGPGEPVTQTNTRGQASDG